MRKPILFLSACLLSLAAAPSLFAKPSSTTTLDSVQLKEPVQVAAAGAVAWRVYDQGLALAKQQNKHTMIQFNASWCGYCRKMDRDFQTDKRLSQILNKHFVPVRITEDSPTKVTYQGKVRSEGSLISEFQVSGYPTLKFLKPNGEELVTFPGYLEPDNFYGMLLYISSKAYEKMPYQQFESKHLPKYL